MQRVWDFCLPVPLLSLVGMVMVKMMMLGVMIRSTASVVPLFLFPVPPLLPGYPLPLSSSTWLSGQWSRERESSSLHPGRSLKRSQKTALFRVTTLYPCVLVRDLDLVTLTSLPLVTALSLSLSLSLSLFLSHFLSLSLSLSLFLSLFLSHFLSLSFSLTSSLSLSRSLALFLSLSFSLTFFLSLSFSRSLSLSPLPFSPSLSLPPLTPLSLCPSESLVSEVKNRYTVLLDAMFVSFLPQQVQVPSEEGEEGLEKGEEGRQLEKTSSALHSLPPRYHHIADSLKNKVRSCPYSISITLISTLPQQPPLCID